MSNGGADQRRHLRWLVASSSWYPLKLPISPLGVWSVLMIMEGAICCGAEGQDPSVGANGIALPMRRFLT